jgi:hypothetical protein
MRAGAAHASASTKGERLLRTIGGQHTPRVFMIPLGEKHLRITLA